jgi:plastocyanin
VAGTRPDPDGAAVQVGAATRTIVDPGASDRLFLPRLPLGTYPFVCTIHDGMTGSLVVKAP